jgi:ATP-binding cassette, subfamily B, heavy metal transporter
LRIVQIDMENMFDLLGTPPAVSDAPGARPLALKGGAVEFRDVWFGYKPERLVLKDIKLTVRAKEGVAGAYVAWRSFACTVRVARKVPALQRA